MVTVRYKLKGSDEIHHVTVEGDITKEISVSVQGLTVITCNSTDIEAMEIINTNIKPDLNGKPFITVQLPVESLVKKAKVKWLSS